MTMQKGLFITSLSIPPSQVAMFEEFRGLAKVRELSVSALMRELMTNYVDAHQVKQEDVAGERVELSAEAVHPLATLDGVADIPPPPIETPTEELMEVDGEPTHTSISPDLQESYW